MTEPRPTPLAGLRVLDFGHTIMGPCAGLLLADLGADVVKIEPVDGDPTRRLPGFAAAFFATYNRNKRSIAIDLKTAEGQGLAHRLAATADVALENFGAGTIERLGCGWADLEPLNPRLIYLSMKGYLAGPYEARGALDEVVQMQSGLAYMTGPPGRPLRAGASVIDMMGGMFGVVAVLAALQERERTGRGQRVGSSLFESAAFLMAPHLGGGVVSGAPMPPFPARQRAWAVYDIFTVAGGEQVFVGVTSDAHWRRFCSIFGFDDLGADARLETNAMRCAEKDWLMPTLERRLAAFTAADITARCEDVTIPFSRIGRPDDLAHDPHLLAGGLLSIALSPLGRGEGERIDIPGLPVEFGSERARPQVDRQPPGPGEHTAEVLAELGLSAGEIADLLGRRIVAADRDDQKAA